MFNSLQKRKHVSLPIAYTMNIKLYVFLDLFNGKFKILSSLTFYKYLCYRAHNMADTLTSMGWPTACIAGSHDQKDRNEAMAKLKTYKCRVLISTDLVSYQ